MGNMPFGLREATVADIRSIAEFQTRCWSQAYRGLVSQEYLDRTTVDTREIRWRQRLVSDGIKMVIAEIEDEALHEPLRHDGRQHEVSRQGVGRQREPRQELLGQEGSRPAGGRPELAGVVSWRVADDVDDAPALELKTLYVDSAHHGRGVAQALTSRALGSMAAHLWVFEENPRAQAFYRKQGFRADGRRMIDVDTGVWEIRMVRL